MLLYEFCLENDYLDKTNANYDEYFYDRIAFKSIVYATFMPDSNSNELSDSANVIKIASQDNQQQIIAELFKFISEKQHTDDNTSINSSLVSINSSNLSSIESSSMKHQRSIKHSFQLDDLSKPTFDYLKNLFVSDALKAVAILQLIFKYNQNCELIFLKVSKYLIKSYIFFFLVSKIFECLVTS